jgi:tetratricopeptide (TPR) repeat protein
VTLAVLCLVLAQAGGAAGQPADRRALIERAQSEIAAGRRVEAKRLLAAAAGKFESVQALLQLARLQASDGEVAAALDALRKARALAPNSEEVLSAFAQVSVTAGAPVPAILALDALTRMCPTVARHHYLLGVALMRGADMPAAVEALREADRLEPDRALTLLALGVTLNNRQQYAEARPFLVRSLEIEPDNLDAVAALAEAEHGVGELEAASTHAAQTLAKVPDHATANLVVGLVAMERGRYADARAALERSALKDPLSLKVHYQLSLACARLGDTAASQKHLETYKQTMRELETRVNEIRRATGPAEGNRKR